MHELERHEEAIASFDKAIALNPDDHAPLYNRGTVLQDLNRLDEALASYDKAIAIKPDHAEAFIDRGHVLMRLRGLDEARASYNRGIALFTDAPEVSRRALAVLPHDHPAKKVATAVSFSRLQDAVNSMILEVTGGKRHFALTEDWIRGLHRFAMDGLLEKPGAYRKKPVWILGSTFEPPKWQEVPALMNDLCRYVNDNWLHRDVVNLCAFIIWRLSWIQPFLDGNGRIARSVAHTAFCIKHRGFPPSKKSLLEHY